MKYGLTKNAQIYSFEKKIADTILLTPGDNIQASMWIAKNGDSVDKDIRGVFEVYAWVFIGMRRLGMLETYSVADELSIDNLMKMADIVSVYLDDVEEDSLPLAKSRKK